MKRFRNPLLIIFIVLALDQFIKIWVKLNFHLTENRSVTSWFYLYFIENEGMAFGITWGGELGKISLTIFRIIASGFIWYWLYRLVKTKAHWGLITCVAMIFAGAVGNIFDSIFYGAIFSESTFNQVAVLFPPDGGYESLLHGRVVDMFYFPLWEGFLPHWIPFWGGEYFVFFQPIFNLADASISTGVISILVFQKWIFLEDKKIAMPLIEEEKSSEEKFNEEKSTEV